jgi:hypothetical protein
MSWFTRSSILALMSFHLHSSAEEFYRVRSIHGKDQSEKILSIHKTELFNQEAGFKQLSEKKIFRSLPFIMAEDTAPSKEFFTDYIIPQTQLTIQHKAFLKNVETSVLEESEAYLQREIRDIGTSRQGPNRINLTILGDGYTLSQKDLFFKDVEKTMKGLFETPTFKSYLPLFAIKAIFIPSRESGIGDGKPKNTAYKLYRNPPGSKRGIFPGDTKALERVIALAPETDYPIVLANDPFYGGLGGRYAISTTSKTTGLFVLRHELGHNFGEVGEEYDRGFVYMGANSTKNKNVSWSHWLRSSLETHEAKLLSGNYVWQNLHQKPFSQTVTIPSDHDQLLLSLSTVGWKTPDDVLVTINKSPVDLNGVFHTDRAFYDPPAILLGTEKKVTLDIREQIQDKDNVLGSALLYSVAPDYNFTPHFVGAFATYDEYGSLSYRPTHSSCLMRTMDIDYFCSVDQENMWLKFFQKIRLIDSTHRDQLQFSISPLNLAPLQINWSVCKKSRSLKCEEKDFEKVSTWDQKEFVDLKNQASEIQMLKVQVSFPHPEIRKTLIQDEFVWSL